MSNEKMRAEFRAAYEREFDTCPRGYIVETGEYTNAHAASAWWSWQASRAALCVELPEVSGHYGHSKYMHGVNDCRSAIESTGVRTR